MHKLENLLMLATATAFTAYHAPLSRRTDVRMSAVASVKSWYDAGTRLAAYDSVVMPTTVTETKATAPSTETKADLLQRYLQLRTALPESAPLPDDAVEALIVETEEEAAATVAVDGRLDGEWRQVWQRTAKEGTASQKALSPVSQKLYQNFIVDADGETIFRNIVQVTKNRVGVTFDVAYDLPDGVREPPNRLPSTIKSARLELSLGRRFGWKPLRVPLPLNGVGWLDVYAAPSTPVDPRTLRFLTWALRRSGRTYLSDDMRITRGNRGGVFVHMREPLLTREAAEAMMG